jgi:hypothetical protein
LLGDARLHSLRVDKVLLEFFLNLGLTDLVDLGCNYLLVELGQFLLYVLLHIELGEVQDTLKDVEESFILIFEDIVHFTNENLNRLIQKFGGLGPHRFLAKVLDLFESFPLHLEFRLFKETLMVMDLGAEGVE